MTMPVDPAIRALLDQVDAAGQPVFGDLADLTVAECRAAAFATKEFNAVPPELESVRERTIPTRSGTVDAIVYRPSAGPPPPVLVFFFGGGFMMGSPQLIDGPVRELAHATGCLVVSAGYRLAPEHPYPAAFEDALDATRWVAEHAAELGGDPEVVAIGGESSGGALAAAVALSCAEAGGPPLAGQLLIYPILDAPRDTPSYASYGERHMLTRRAVEMCWHNVLGGREPDRFAAPARADDVSGLPPATIMLAECDPLFCDGAAHAERLREAGVPVELVVGEGLIHGAWQMSGITEGARAWGRAGGETFARQLERALDRRS